MKIARMSNSAILTKLRETEEQLLKNGQSLFKRDGCTTVAIPSLPVHTQHMIEALRTRGVPLEG